MPKKLDVYNVYDDAWKSPIMTPMGTNSGYALVMTGTNEVLGVVGSAHALVQHQAVLNQVKAAVDAAGVRAQYRLSRYGSTARMLVITDQQYTLPNGEPVHFGVVVGNDVAGNRSLTVDAWVYHPRHNRGMSVGRLLDGRIKAVHRASSRRNLTEGHAPVAADFWEQTRRKVLDYMLLAMSEFPDLIDTIIKARSEPMYLEYADDHLDVPGRFRERMVRALYGEDAKDFPVLAVAASSPTHMPTIWDAYDFIAKHVNDEDIALGTLERYETAAQMFLLPLRSAKPTVSASPPAAPVGAPVGSNPSTPAAKPPATGGTTAAHTS